MRKILVVITSLLITNFHLFASAPMPEKPIRCRATYCVTSLEGERIAIDKYCIEMCPNLKYDYFRVFPFKDFSTCSIRIFFQCLDYISFLSSKELDFNAFKCLKSYVVRLLGAEQTQIRHDICREAIAILDAFNINELELSEPLYTCLRIF